MLKCERGFILPLAMILSLLFSALVIHQIDLLESDRLFFQERKNYFQHGLLLQSASNEWLSQIEKSDTIEENGQFTFELGTVTYRVMRSDEETVTIEFKSKTELTGERKATAIYELETNSIMKWTE